MKEAFTFKTQLKKGAWGEEYFLQNYTEAPIMKFAERYADFITNGGIKIELKTDFYPDPKNMFMEYKTISGDKEKLGGPWRAYADGVDLFIYFFPATSLCYTFNTGTLLEFLDSYVKKLRVISVPNRGFFGQGYKIPITVLAPLAKVSTLSVLRERDLEFQTLSEEEP